MSLRLKPIPEYEPVSKIYLSFVQDFYNSRFHFGKAITQITRSALPYVKVEIFVDKNEEILLENELKIFGISLNDIEINHNSPRRAIINEWAPIFCIDENNKPFGLSFKWLSNHPNYNELKFQEKFAKWLIKQLNIEEIFIDFDFCTVALSSSDGLVLISDSYFKDVNDENFKKIKNIFSELKLFLVPSLADESTKDLDTFLLPVKDKVWIVPEYPEHSAQAKSIKNTLNLLREEGHTVHFIPALEKIEYDDIRCYPNYNNCIILNNAAIVPTYDRKEDCVIQGILKEYGFDIYLVDSRDIILANCGPHCISKTVPKIIVN